MKFQIIVAAVIPMLLAVGGAHAEITSKVYSVKGDIIKLPAGTECFVKERGLLFHGGESSISGLFAESGLTISKDTNSDCVLIVGASIYVQHKNNPTSTLVTKLVNENDIMEEAKNFSATDTQDDPKSTVGEGAGASVGASFGLAGAAAGAIIGSAIDSRATKYISSNAAGVRVDVVLKDSQGKKMSMEIQVLATAEPFDRPITVLRAAVKRTVAEIQVQPEAASNASVPAEPQPTNQEVH
jgi:hypothetical protein